MEIKLDFSGYVAMCSGGASGMGLLAGQKFAASGAKVVLCDINESAVLAAAAEICASGGEAIGLQVDVREYSQIAQAVKTTVDKFGRVDYLINAAGGASSRIFQCSNAFRDRDPEILSWGLDVNLKGALLFDRAVIGQMLDQKHGVIIHFGSVSGEEPSPSCPDYAASKSAMHGLTKAIAAYGAPHVRCCCVVPGPVLTRPGMANMKTPLGRAAEPWELVDFILYLCDDKHGGFFTGSSHVLDGGRLLANYK
ncbi:MAG: SDR family oxidoreductase [Lentisphaerae bacterium]|jgi:NAD(P)-dependent dehydrogenase (short-subunit alcohol dehydrogenase family)|nr:SDR family oxidoreductase [Lentisphaerota bacterium]